MFRSKKLAGFLLTLTLMGTTAVFAQTPQLPQQQEQQKVEVTDAEMNKFAKAFQGIRVIGQQSQQEMVQVVQNGGMKIERFNKIHEATLNPNLEVEATTEEKTQHKEIISKLEVMQASLQEQMEKVITDAGLSLERYEQIAMGLQNDPELQQRLQAVLQG
ncbi:DUF4168 domain-containing protein [Salinimicrobium flavum]|uniref:DUF4168 domain-containing protein n=1 Tax=Salinimicrobium flavum TaxID=1737065 RepID=A0ABW5IV44_9FLAO